jgi:segregation and condensation protein B
MSFERTIEAILFTLGKSVSLSSLEKILHVDQRELKEIMQKLKEKWNQDTCGILLLEQEDKWQFVSHPDEAVWIQSFMKDEFEGELTRPSLETLTIIAYRGPMTKPEIEQIRGVNCHLILRNLLLRGLIEEQNLKDEIQTKYSISSDFLRHLGLTDIRDLPDYEKLHEDKSLDLFLSQNTPL